MRQSLNKQQLRKFFSMFKRKPEKVEIKHKPVVSSNIESVGYNPGVKVMEVKFKGSSEKPGNIYKYYNVDESKYKGILRAKSKGSYLNKRIKDNFKYEKIG